MTKLGDIATDTLQRVAEHRRAGLTDHDRAVGVPQAEIEAFERTLAPERAVDGGSTLVVEKIEGAREVVEKVRRRVTEDALDRGADIVEMWLRTGYEVPDDVGRFVSEIAKACFTLGQPELGEVSFGDIAADRQHFRTLRTDEVAVDPGQPLPRSVR